MATGDERMEEEGKDAYELGYVDGKIQQPKLDLLFTEPYDTRFYNAGWHTGFAESFPLK